MKPTERKLAESLRRQGATYQEILRQVPVSKSTLSMEIRRKFVECNECKHQAAVARHRVWEDEAKTECGPLSAETLKWVGAALYWGEGAKVGAKRHVKFANCDPDMIHLIMRWFREICRVPERKFRASVQIHEEQGLDAVEEYWSQMTGIPRGTLHISICDTQLSHRILGWIQGFSAPSSSGLGRSVLSQETGVRFPVGPPLVREPAGVYAASLS